MIIPEQGLGYLRPYQTAKGPRYLDVLGKERVYDGNLRPTLQHVWKAVDNSAAGGFKEEPLVNFLMSLATFTFAKPTTGVREFKTLTDADPEPIFHVDCNPWGYGEVAPYEAGKQVAEKVRNLTIERLCEVAHPSNSDDPEGPLYCRKFYGPYLAIHRGAFKIPKLVHRDGSRKTPGTEWAINGDADLLVQITPDVLRYVVGFAPTVIRTEEGFKVVCSITPQVRSDYHKNYGVCFLPGGDL